MQILIFFGILSLVVVIHELGHLFAAKMFGIKAEEFGFGLPPKLFRLFRKGETDYTINLLPIGGFVRLYGEEGEKDPLTADNRAFWSKPVWQRSAVVVAGVVMNFLLSIILFAIVYSFLGIPTKVQGIKIDQVVEGSPMAQLQVKEGDVVKKVVVDGQTQTVAEVDKFLGLVSENKGKEIELVFGSGRDIKVVPRVNPPEGEGALGVVISDTEFKQYVWWQMPFRGMVVGVEEAVLWGKEIVSGFGQMLYRLISGKGLNRQEVAGPIGIYQLTGTVSKAGILPLIQFVGVLSINLAILNIIPFPALDGGRLAFLLLELVIGKKVKNTVESWIHSVGMIILLGLMVLVTINDILKLQIRWPFGG